MPQSNPPYVPVFGSGAPGTVLGQGRIYFDTSANYQPYISNAGVMQKVIAAPLGTNSVSGVVKADNDTLQITTPGTIRSKRNDISFNFVGVPGNAAKFTYIANRAFSIPASLTGTQAVIGTNPTGSLTVTLNKNGSSFGTIAFSTGGAVTLTSAAGATFAIGDVLTAVCPNPADATGADIAATLQGFLS